MVKDINIICSFIYVQKITGVSERTALVKSPGQTSCKNISHFTPGPEPSDTDKKKKQKKNNNFHPEVAVD